MIIKEALHQASKTLAAHPIEDAPLEAELLLMHILGIDRAKLYTRLGEELPADDAEALAQLVDRRLSHEPTAYIVGHREFFGHDFYVTPGVLIPRPESELLVEEALFELWERSGRGKPLGELLLTDDKPPTCEKIADVGTGSGAIAISLALILPMAKIYATDISAPALEIARVNCQRHGVQDRVYLLEGDLLEPLPGPVDIIVANLPYIGDEDWSELSAEIRMYEPTVALAGGRDGLDKMRQLLSTVNEKLRTGGLILLEIGPGQGQAAATLAQDLFPGARIGLARDLGGRERVLKVVLT